jgi:nucleotide-binding universal stress UspA family protein
MIDLKRILAPTDFSEHSANALKYAAAFAEKFDCELHLLHVVQDLGVMVPDLVTAAPPMLPSVDQMSVAARTALDRVAKENDLERFRLHKHVSQGTPFYEIIRLAREADVDLIVMGTHGRTGLRHVLMGSVCDKVVRKAPCPVLTVRHPEHEFVHP